MSSKLNKKKLKKKVIKYITIHSFIYKTAVHKYFNGKFIVKTRLQLRVGNEWRGKEVLKTIKQLLFI